MGGDVKTIDKPRGIKMPAAPHAAHSVTPDELANLRESEARLRALVDSAGVLMWTARTDGARDYFNQGWLDFTGRSLADELGDGWLRNVHPDDRELTVENYEKSASAGAHGAFEYRLRSKNGQYRWMLATTVPRLGAAAEPLGMAGTCVDITEHRQSQHELQKLLAASDEAHANLAEHTRRLHRLADTDPLTGLLNRRGFRQQFEREWIRSLRYQRPLSCIMLDLDFFKRINDTQGHAAGDAALQQVGQLVSDQCRPSDTVCRYGGEEFCIMVPETNEVGAATLAERIRLKLAQTPLELETRTLSVSASFGVADCVGELDRADDLIERADRALHVAKHSGRNRVVQFSSNDSLVEWISQHNAARVLAETTARDLLTPTPSVRADATIAEAVDILLNHRVSSAPVVDAHGKVAGFISERDLMMLNVSPESWQTRVGEIMKSNVVCYEEGAPGSQVFQFLCRALIHRVVIAQSGRPVGVISPGSLLAYFRDSVAQAAATSAADD